MTKRPNRKAKLKRQRRHKRRPKRCYRCKKAHHDLRLCNAVVVPNRPSVQGQHSEGPIYVCPNCEDLHALDQTVQREQGSMLDRIRALNEADTTLVPLSKMKLGTSHGTRIEYDRAPSPKAQKQMKALGITFGAKLR